MKKNKTQEGTKYYFRCNLVKYRDEQCEASIYINLHSIDTKCSIWRSVCAHTHFKNAKILSISEKTKIAIEELFKLGVTKPHALINALEARNEQVPILKHLYNYLAVFKKSKFGHTNLSLGELCQWCEDYSAVPGPDSPDEPFVVSYEFYMDIEEMDEKERQNLNNYEDGDIFRIFVSTRRLIDFSENVKVLFQADGTYKLVWQGFPVLVIGTSDADKVFHPLGISITTKERKFDYKFLFNGIVNGRKLLGLNPLVSNLSLMADGADAITNGFELSGFFGTRGMCWFHVTKNIKSRLLLLESKSKSSEINQDIHFMQLS